MADVAQGVQGTHNKAVKEGNDLRKSERGSLRTVVIVIAIFVLVAAFIHIGSEIASAAKRTDRIATTTTPAVLLGWRTYRVPPAGSDPLIVPVGFRYGCFDPQIRNRVILKKEGFDTSNFRYELVSKTDDWQEVEILVANSKEKARAITPGC